MRGGTDVSFAGASARIQFRKTVKSPVIYEMTTENGRIAISGNWAVLHFTDESTAEIDIRDRIRMFGHLEITLASGETVRIVELNVILEPEITRDD